MSAGYKETSEKGFKVEKDKDTKDKEKDKEMLEKRTKEKEKEKEGDSLKCLGIDKLKDDMADKLLADKTSKDCDRPPKGGKEVVKEKERESSGSIHPLAALHRRVAALEAALGIGAPFIAPEERPALGEAAINQPLDEE